MNIEKIAPIVIIGLLALSLKNNPANGRTFLMNRGTRNKNWLNVRASSPTYWDGQLALDDKGFAIFTDPVYSLRAGFKLFNTYKTKYGLDTIKSIIYRFAPPGDGNDTANYISFVSNKTGIPSDQKLSKAQWPVIIKWMAKMETANLPTNEQLKKAYELAGV